MLHRPVDFGLHRSCLQLAPESLKGGSRAQGQFMDWPRRVQLWGGAVTPVFCLVSPLPGGKAEQHHRESPGKGLGGGGPSRLKRRLCLMGPTPLTTILALGCRQGKALSQDMPPLGLSRNCDPPLSPLASHCLSPGKVAGWVSSRERGRGNHSLMFLSLPSPLSENE